jgi:hypothetical protein
VKNSFAAALKSKRLFLDHWPDQQFRVPGSAFYFSQTIHFV